MIRDLRSLPGSRGVSIYDVAGVVRRGFRRVGEGEGEGDGVNGNGNGDGDGDEADAAGKRMETQDHDQQAYEMWVRGGKVVEVDVGECLSWGGVR